MKINHRESICRIFLLTVSLLIIWGCGIYSFSGSNLPAHIRTAAVPLFENETSEFGVDQQLTDEVINKITADNTLKIAGNRSADSIIKGKILRVVDRAGQYNRDEKASSFRVTITVAVSFVDAKKRKTIWQETWSQWGDYTNNRDDGIKEAVDKLSTDILNKTVSGW